MRLNTLGIGDENEKSIARVYIWLPITKSFIKVKQFTFDTLIKKLLLVCTYCLKQFWYSLLANHSNSMISYFV